VGFTALFSSGLLRRVRDGVGRRRRRITARVEAVIAAPTEAFAEQAGVARVDDGTGEDPDDRR